jgi:hypothetical protein
MPNKLYFERLLDAQDEREVRSIIENIEHTYDVDWLPIGRQENNYGVVEAQASSPLGALTELISNSIDAVLRKRYRLLYQDEYDEKHDINSYSEAADALLSDNDEEISLKADGYKPTTRDVMNLILSDSGEGQTLDTFEDTFVGLLEPGMSKQSWPFLQGQFGMGSTAVLPHCGDSGYKLIASAGIEQPEHWTFTLIRKNRDGNAYQYFKVDEQLPHFEGTPQEQAVGSIIKLFDYQTATKSSIIDHIRYRLARVIVKSPLDIRMIETRYNDSQSRSAQVVGLKTLIDRHQNYIQTQKKVSYDFGAPLGQRDVDLVVFKADQEVKDDEELRIGTGKQRMFISRRRQQNRSIFFTVNEQVHGDLGMSFVQNRCDKYHTGKDIMAFVDFSDLGPAELTDLFKPSRDRLTKKPMAERLEDGMEDLISNDPTIQQIEDTRRREFTADKREEKLGDMLEELVERNPQLLDYLRDGSRINKLDDGLDKTESDYVAPYYPDKFEIITSKLGGEFEFWEEDEAFKKEVPVNRNSWIRLFLNAQNSFFTRERHQGVFMATPQECVRSWGINDGQLSLQLTPLPNVEPGTVYPMTLEIGAEGMEPLKQQFKLEFVEEVEERSTSSNDEMPPIDSLDFPNIESIREPEWESHYAEWDEQTPVQIEGSESDDMTIWVNFDAGPLRNFISRYNFRKTGKETIRETWKAGVAIYTLSTYLELKSEFQEESVNSRDIAAVSMKGVTQSMLDQHISQKEIDYLTV